MDGCKNKKMKLNFIKLKKNLDKICSIARMVVFGCDTAAILNPMYQNGKFWIESGAAKRNEDNIAAKR